MDRELASQGVGETPAAVAPRPDFDLLLVSPRHEPRQRTGREPAIVWLQAGDLNTGSFDAFEPACALARAALPR